MFKNYLKIAVRSLFRHKTYSLINILGLSGGICVSTLILMFVVHEHSFDRFHSRHSDIYRVLGKVKMGDNEFQMNSFAATFAPVLREGVPRVADYVRVLPSYRNTAMANPARKDEAILEKDILFADPSFFSVFSFPLEKGNAADALQKPFSMVISERAAEKYFGNTDVIGKALLYEGKHLVQISGVARNAPSNSSLDFDFVISSATYPKLSEANKQNWEAGAGIFNAYLLLDAGASKAKVERGINQLGSLKETAGELKPQYTLESLDDMHLGGAFTDSGNSKLIPIFAVAAIAVLMLALFNYMSLTTARATQRAREVGVRKVVGATRAGLGSQFYMESALVCALAFGLGLLMVFYLSQPFYTLLGLKIDTSFVISPFFLSFLAGLLAITALVAGSYPAFVLSGFAPLEVIKGRFTGNIGGVGVRRVFIVFQFAVSMALIVGSLIVREQLVFMQRKELGLNKDQVLSIPLGPSMAANYIPFRNAVRQQAGVLNATFANAGLFKGYNMFFIPNKITKKDISLAQMVVDEQFVKTLGLQWKISPPAGTQRSQALLNEQAVTELGFKGDPIGQQIREGMTLDGIVKNFDFSDVQHGGKAMMLSVATDTTNMLRMPGAARGVMYVRMDAQTDIAASVKKIGELFKKYDLETPFEYYFLDDAFNETFKNEMRLSGMFSVFTVLAIFIACMGLFGLITFTTETRTKEIGIRKILGASAAGIVGMLSREFVVLVLISGVIAMPAAWYFMSHWLEDFAYRISVPWWVHFLTITMMLLITLLTVGLKAVHAAMVNPAASLRND
ncbi:putative ABC transport system permease protein [Dyadobacter sp. BE34]|uniref:ABC transport system permease protein n=1 Tax=Dyadobacter fermentans TaxID=94254 RepID=A0ABU1QRS9_9BACT|nr:MULTISPECIES: FtsX-like permease family protein [Dyadobacter]MDR6803849.1 putative ABC transport system permease protein [Dyadobacter fermentans]MDR7041589.1 putative ABC transport system permease protein [Dyadobacter sp. BE242]MDR7195992.1 putative ABC transport system permease protein [Dyadobacter sp. BE34]MDR7213463.1 putative ABC transport system permease protein [Dyadobacter sp. BE31]MDR7261398.1 putative ABC transport system permease protein [Dyadobacter sp. BE32]